MQYSEPLASSKVQPSTWSTFFCADKLILISRQWNRINILVIIYFQLKYLCAMNNNKREPRLSNVWGWVPWINIYEPKINVLTS